MTFILLGILLILYFLCVAVFTGHGLGFHFIWLLAGIAMIAFGYCMRKGILIHRIPVLFKRIFLILLCMGILLFLFVEGRILSGFTAKGEEGLTAVIVLGAQMKTEGPSRVLKMRLDEAYDYLAENPQTIAVVSGGKGGDEPVSEAQGMFDYLTGRGIAPERILMEDRSRNTKENISFSSELVDTGNDRIGIITSNFHIFRATQIAKKYGFQKVCGIAAGSDIFMLPNNMTREFFGVVKDFLVGNI